MMQLDTRVDQTYAHFHRVLGELLTELSALPGVLWLSDKEHVLRGEVSVTPTLEPSTEYLVWGRTVNASLS